MIRSVGLIGAGAVGAYFIWGTEDVHDIDFYLIAEGERRERLLSEGLLINGKLYRLPVLTPEEAHEKGCDLILLAVKYGGLMSALSEIERAVCDHTLVMSLLNGIDSEELIAERIGERRVVRALMQIASRRADGKIEFDPEKTVGVFYGGKDEKTIDELTAFFAGTKVKYHISDDIIQSQWNKFRINICYNIPQALLSVGYGAYFTSEHIQYMLRALEAELIQVAAAEGITIEPLELVSQGYAQNARYSTLQDLDAGRHTEIDMFLGTIMKKGEEHGIPTPVSAYTYHAIKALEEKNDGMFNF